jgi:hypothetical protein
MYNIVGERSEHSAMEILKKEWFFTLPLVIITIFMLSGYSPGYSAILGWPPVVVSYKYQETRIDYTLAVVMALVLATQMISLLLSKTVGPEAGRSFNHMVSEKDHGVFRISCLCDLVCDQKRASPGHSSRTEAFRRCLPVRYGKQPEDRRHPRRHRDHHRRIDLYRIGADLCRHRHRTGRRFSPLRSCLSRWPPSFSAWACRSPRPT